MTNAINIHAWPIRFIQYNGDLEVHNSLLNVVLHDNPQLRSKQD